MTRTRGGVRGALRSILGGAVYSIMESAEIHSLDSSHKPHLNTYFSSVFPHLGWDFKFSVVFSSAQYLSMIYFALTHPFCVLLRCGFCPHPAHAIVALNGINPQKWMEYVLSNIADYKINKLHELLPHHISAKKIEKYKPFWEV